MSEHTRYGFDPLLQRWVPRDEMLGINVKVFGGEEEYVIRIRLSPKKHEALIDFLREIEWRDEMKFESELGVMDHRVGDVGPPELLPTLISERTRK